MVCHVSPGDVSNPYGFLISFPLVLFEPPSYARIPITPQKAPEVRDYEEFVKYESWSFSYSFCWWSAAIASNILPVIITSSVVRSDHSVPLFSYFVLLERKRKKYCWHDQCSAHPLSTRQVYSSIWIHPAVLLFYLFYILFYFILFYSLLFYSERRSRKKEQYLAVNNLIRAIPNGRLIKSQVDGLINLVSPVYLLYHFSSLSFSLFFSFFIFSFSFFLCFFLNLLFWITYLQI